MPEMCCMQTARCYPAQFSLLVILTFDDIYSHALLLDTLFILENLNVHEIVLAIYIPLRQLPVIDTASKKICVDTLKFLL